MDPNNELTIREALPSDRYALEELRPRLQSHTEASSRLVWHVTDEGRERLIGGIDKLLFDRNGRVLVAETGEDIVGYIYGHVSHRAEYTPRIIGFINGIYVRKTHRKKPIGTRLVRELCKFFTSRDVEEVNLRYVIGNMEGESFWSALGFKPVIQIVNTSLEALHERLNRSSKASRPQKLHRS